MLTLDHQGAVNAAGPGAIISVAPGVYDETVYVNKPLTIQGQPGAVIRPGSSTAMLIGGGTLRAAILVDGIDGVTISGFEIDGSIAAVNYGIYFYNSQGSSAIGNTIHDMSNNAEDSAGIGLLFFGWTKSVQNEIVQGNTVYNCPRMGVFIGGQQSSSSWYLSGYNSITGNDIYNTWTGPTSQTGQAALTMVGAQGTDISYNTIHDNFHQVGGYSVGYGIYLSGSAAPASTLTHNTIYGNVQGIATVSDRSDVDFGSINIAAPMVNYNSIYGNSLYGLRADLSNPILVTDATMNWWGSPLGPGPSIYGYANYNPFYIDAAMTTLSNGSSPCEEGSTQTCTYCSGTSTCTGTQTCVSGSWGSCSAGSCSCIVGQCGTTSCNSSQSMLTVNVNDMSGSSLIGYYTVLYRNGVTAGTGFSPANFSLESGQPYSVEPQDYGDYHFDRWMDTNSTARNRDISINSDTQITAIYSSTTNSTPPGQSDVSVITVDLGGSQISGLYTVLYQNGAAIGNGFSMATFSVENGHEYEVEVQDYGKYKFSHWSDNQTLRRRAFVASGPVVFTVVYKTGQPSSQSTVRVSTVDSSNATISGYYTTLWQNGQLVSSAFSPASFNISGGNYQVAVSDYGSYVFDHWSDGTANRFHTVSGSSDLQAIYRVL
jgi:hypothetical protein